MNSAENLYKPAFSHIYMEKAAAGYDRTQRILRHFPDAHLITVDSYKDLFYRPAQDFSAQQRSRCLILAVRRDNFVFPGAPVCQSFGNEHFYYTSCTMNCLYDCEYCYLKGMYPSGDLVVFVNTEEYFPHLDALLEKFPVYLCISYDTDLLAMEKLTGICRAWIDYAAGKENLTIELRTKAADPAIWEAPALPNVIYAFTISPQAAAAKYEHGAPAPGRRVACAAEGIRRILDLIARKQPQAKILLSPIFPRGKPDDNRRAVNEKVNAIIKGFADGNRVIWLDFNARFLESDGTFKPNVMVGDLLHPYRDGYEIWLDAMLPHLKDICGR